jgi:hypothetical protein
MSSSLEKSKNKKPMEADPTSGEEQVHAKKMNPGREEAPAPLPVPAGRPAFFIDPKCLRAKIERDRLAAKLGLIPSLPHAPLAFPSLANWYVASVSQIFLGLLV